MALDCGQVKPCDLLLESEKAGAYERVLNGSGNAALYLRLLAFYI